MTLINITKHVIKNEVDGRETLHMCLSLCLNHIFSDNEMILSQIGLYWFFEI